MSKFGQLHLRLECSAEFTTTLRATKRYGTIRNLGYVLYPILIGIPLVSYANRKIKELSPSKQALESRVLDEIRSSSNQVDRLADGPLKFHPTYLTWSIRTAMLDELEEYQKNLMIVRKAPGLRNAITLEIDSALKSVSKAHAAIEAYNEIFVQERRTEYQPLFARASVRLDESQERAIVTDDKHNFVIAAAGSGKTEVLTDRIAYLVLRSPDTINPSRILALAFQRNAAQEIEKRLYEKFGISGIKVKTFHSLGLEILRAAGNQARVGPADEKQYSDLVRSLYEAANKRSTFVEMVVEYMKNFDLTSPREEVDFAGQEEYYHYLRRINYLTLNGTKVKSEAEKAIMNFFLSHKINGKRISIFYEDPAYWMKYKNEKGEIIVPRPDFHLSDYDIYIEHWALDAEGNVPAWFSDPAEYKASMKKKTDAYRSYGKSLIQTTSAEFSGPSFLAELQRKLMEVLKTKFPTDQFILSPIPYEELIQGVYYDIRVGVRELPYLISRFIIIAKTYGFEPRRIEERLLRETWTTRQIAFARIALEIYREYETWLKSNTEIDFSDMINLASGALSDSTGLYSGLFDQILVDEYQDLSTQRYRLLKALMQKNADCKLFAVGDDWQSIMGFAGSNLDYTLRFSEYFEHPAITRLSTNYRSAKSIVSLGNAIISHNKDRIQKEVVAKNSAEPRILLCSSTADKYDWLSYRYQMVDHCTSKIREYLDNGYKPSDLLILVRITRSPKLMNRLFESAQTKGITLSTNKRNPHAVPVISVHRSKGMQARAVFLLNVIDHMYGFPCKVEDLDLFAPATQGSRRATEDEERRLFYVAVTRAKENLTVYSQNCRSSKFIQEVRRSFAEEVLGLPED